MEIIQVFGIHWKLLVAQLVNFTIVLFVLHRYLYKPVFAMLEKRQALIAKGIEDAANAAIEKEGIESTKTEILRASREEGGEIVKTLRMKAIEAEHEILRDAQEKSVAILGEARKNAEEERAHILRESEKDVARMAVLAAEKILRAGAAHS